MNLDAPFGFFGAGNIGDEATLQGFSRLVSRYNGGLNVWVASRNPGHTARVAPSFKSYNSRKRNLRKSWARLRSNAQVIVGGTPIMDVLGNWPLSELVPLVLASCAQSKPIAFVGCGIEDLLREESKRAVAEVLAPGVKRWSVRCQRDKDRLVSYGVAANRVTVAADLAWLLDPVAVDFGRECLTQLGLDVDVPYVGVNLNGEKFVLRKEPRLFEKTAAFLDGIVEEHDARILFFANEVREGETYDNVANRNVLAKMRHQDRAFVVPNKYWTPQQMLSLIGSCEVTIGIRYHFCLFSALQSVPFIALKRSDKVDDLCWDMDWPYAASVTDLNVDELHRMFSEIKRKKTELAEGLKRQTPLMRERAQKNSAVLDALNRIEVMPTFEQSAACRGPIA